MMTYNNKMATFSWKETVTECLPAVHFHCVVVDLLVEYVAPVVFKGIFDGNNSEDQQQRDHSDLLLKGLHNGNPVQQSQEQEVQVCRSVQIKPD